MTEAGEQRGLVREIAAVVAIQPVRHQQHRGIAGQQAPCPQPVELREIGRDAGPAAPVLHHRVGARQRLVGIALQLRLLQNRVGDDPSAQELVTTASDELAHSLSELRELARGIHPAVLSDRGLPAALESLAGRSPVPVEVATESAGRLPEPVELAAYYVVSEALANVAKYSEASQASVHVARENGHVLVSVSDDGIGGADPGRGTGLRGLADRLKAIEGRLEVESFPGYGTTVKASIPCE